MDRKAIYKLGCGLYVLSTKDGERDGACIINTVLQVTNADPIVAAVAVNKSTLTHEMIEKSRVFNLSVLTKEAPFAIYERFGYQSGRDVDKFAGFASVARSENGLVYVTENTNAFLSFRVTETKDFGSHTMFIAEATGGQVLSDDESVTYELYQSSVKPQPKSEKKATWRCVICDYVYEGEELPEDFICPLCKHGVADFVRE